MKTLKDERYVFEILLYYHILRVHAIPTHGVYRLNNLPTL